MTSAFRSCNSAMQHPFHSPAISGSGGYSGAALPVSIRVPGGPDRQLVMKDVARVPAALGLLKPRIVVLVVEGPEAHPGMVPRRVGQVGVRVVDERAVGDI